MCVASFTMRLSRFFRLVSLALIGCICCDGWAFVSVTCDYWRVMYFCCCSISMERILKELPYTVECVCTILFLITEIYSIIQIYVLVR